MQVLSKWSPLVITMQCNHNWLLDFFVRHYIYMGGFVWGFLMFKICIPLEYTWHVTVRRGKRQLCAILFIKFFYLLKAAFQDELKNAWGFIYQHQQ